MGHSHFDTGGPSMEHNENFSERCKGQVQLEFGQFFNYLHDLNRLWTVRDLYGQTALLPLVLRIFSFAAILRLPRANLRRQRRISAPALPDFAYESCLLSRSRLGGAV
tara:strand:- start:777 stop:1100 length:324 start_codon:yes stop_codon:yes gene_type:complete